MSDESEKADFQGLMSRLSAGDERAVKEVIDRYGQRVLAVVRFSLNRKLRSKFDSVDFQQAVWASFVAHLDRVAWMESPEQLGKWLTTVARNKVVEEGQRRLHSKKRSIDREVGIEATALVASSDPTPSQELIARERWEQLNEGLSPAQAEMLRLRSYGETLEDIAKRLGVNERTVRRTMERIAVRAER